MRRWVSVLAVVLGCAVGAEAAPVDELELSGTASNNSLATAQLIPTSAFTLPVPETVFDPPGFRTASLFGSGGTPDVDVFRISGHGQLLLDIDTDDGGHPDTVLFIFNSSGVQLAVNDDAGNDPGSLNHHDSLILFALPQPGVYFVGITSFSNWTEDCCSFDEAFSQNGPQPSPDEPNAGGYVLHLSLEHPHPFRVSVPATLALLVSSGVLAFGARFWRR